MGKLVETFLIFTWFCATHTQKMGPFKVLINHVENCGALDGKAWLFQPKIKKYNRTVFALDGPLHITQDFDDSPEIKIVMAQFTNNGWKENFFQQIFKNGCSTVKSYGTDLFNNILSSMGARAKCPVRKGNYTLHNFPLTVHINNVPAFFYNKYKFNFKLVDKSYVLYCFNAIVDVVPKKP